MDATIISIEAIDQVPERQQLTPGEVLSLKSRKFSDSGNLAYIFQLKIVAKVVLTGNIDISNRLING